MKKTKKIWLIIAICLIVSGALVCFFTLFAMGFDFQKLSTENKITRNFEINKSFDSINIVSDGCNINLVRSNGEKYTAVYQGDEKTDISLKCENGVLTLNSSGSDNWIDYIGMSTFGNEITLYLPDKCFKKICIKTSSGAVNIKNCDTDTLNANTSSGAVDIKDCNADISNINTSSGNVSFNFLSAEKVKIKTSSGNVYGSFADERTYTVSSSSGNISVPENSCGKPCEITTSSGNITVE